MASKSRSFTSVQLVIAVIITAVVTIGILVFSMGNTQNYKGDAAGRPTNLSVPAQAQEKVDMALANMDDVVDQIEAYNQSPGARAGDIVALARQLEESQGDIEYLLAAVRVTGRMDTGLSETELENSLVRAEEALNESSEVAPERAQKAISEALVMVQEALANLE